LIHFYKSQISDIVTSFRKKIMWVNFEATPAFGCARSRAPYQVTESHPYCSSANQQSGVKYFPKTYINSMCEGDYFYLGYKQIIESPKLEPRSLSSLPFNVKMRWNK